MYSNDRQCNVYLLCTSCWWKVLEKSTVSWFWSAGGRCGKNRRQVAFEKGNKTIHHYSTLKNEIIKKIYFIIFYFFHTRSVFSARQDLVSHGYQSTVTINRTHG